MRSLRVFLVFGALGALAWGQMVPEILYYRFNEGGGTATLNAAVPGGGSPVATLMGGIGFGAGQFGTGLVGTGQSSASDFVATGYAMNLQGMSWTLEFWFSPYAGSSLQYLAGVPISGQFRVFAGSPGANMVMSGTGITTVIMTGAIPQVGNWVHVAFVFDNTSTPPAIIPYVNGLPQAPVSQTGSPVLNTGQFIVGGQTSNGLNGIMDEFRLWSRARTAAEIFAAYNMELSSHNILTAQTAGGGVGDLTLTLTSISPGASTGYILLSGVTTGPVGSGPLLGIMPEGLTWSLLTQPLVPGNPFHFPIGIPGVFPDAPFLLPAGYLSNLAGTSTDAVALLLDPAGTYAGHSSVVRVSW